MTCAVERSGRTRYPTFVAACLILAASTALADPAPAAPPVTTNDVTINLIHLLVQQHIITARQADALFKQAQQQAAAQAAAPVPAPPAAPQPAARGGVKLAEPIPIPASPATNAPSRSVRVTYVPEVVREEIKQQVKAELLDDSKKPGSTWGGVPDWVRRLHISGDVRLRYERQFYDPSNDPDFVDFNTINSGSGYDVNLPNEPNATAVPPPLLNSTENRQRFRVRGRIGIVSDISDDLSAGFRLTTGDGIGDKSPTPVSPNQTLGNDFNKFNVTFDRLYFDYHPYDWIKVRGGRFANPWFSTDLMWYSDLNFDGLVVEGVKEFSGHVRPFVTLGAFPVENTALSFPSNSETKYPSRDKWLFAAQAGASWLMAPKTVLKGGVAFYDYQNIDGQFSAPCVASATSIACPTDPSRAGFSQKGNTMFGIRDVQTAGGSTATPEFQYFGLASPFRVLDVAARLDYGAYEPIHVIVDGEAAINLAYDRRRIVARNPVNNLVCAGTSSTTCVNEFTSGNTAFIGQITIGHPEIKERGDWNAIAAYKYLEADSVVDAFTDPDFHEGGTNAKGYVVTGNLGLAHNLWLTAKYLSATEVSGPPLGIDVLQLDVNARF